jgi:hypothetical protein
MLCDISQVGVRYDSAPGSPMAIVSIIRPPTWQNWGHHRVRVSVVVDEQD